MKTECTILALTISLSTCWATEKITTKVHFGKASKGCTGFGVCKAQTTTQSGALTTTWEFHPEDKTLILNIPEDDLAGHEGQIVRSQFIQEEDYALPADICRQLGASELLIPAGQYSARLSDGRYIITFSVRAE